MVELTTLTKLLIVLGIAISVYFIYSKSQSSSTPPPDPPTNSPTSAPTSSTTLAPTSSPTIQSGTIPDISGVWEVYDSTGKTNYYFTMTFASNTASVPDSVKDQFPLRDMTYTTSSNPPPKPPGPYISGTYTDGSTIVLPLSYSENKVTIYAPNNKPLYVLKIKPTPSPTTPSPSPTPSPSSTISSSTTPIPSSSPSSSPTPSASPTASPTDPPSTVKGRYIQIMGESQCLSFANIKIYSTPYGNNTASNATVTSSSYSGGTPDVGSIVSPITKRLQPFSTSCADLVASKIELKTDDQAPWIMIDLGSVVPIYKIVLQTTVLPIMAIGAVLSILDGTKNTVFTGKPLTDVTGKAKSSGITSSNIGMLSFGFGMNLSNMYEFFTFYPSLSTTWQGGAVVNYLVGNWASADGKSALTINNDSTLSLNTLNGPVQNGTYNLVSFYSAYTKLGVKPQSTTSPPTPTKIAPLDKIAKIGSETTPPPAQPSANIVVFPSNDMPLKFNDSTYYSNHFPDQTWVEKGVEVIFGADMSVSGTNKGTYKLTGNDKGTMNVGNGDVAISSYLTSNEKRVVTIGSIDYYPNILIGTWVSIDQPIPISCAFAKDGTCVINGQNCKYSSGSVSIDTTFDYTYTISNSSGIPIYYAASNRGMMFLYPITDGQVLNKQGITMIKNPYFGTWSGNVISSGAVVTWKIDNFTVTEPKGNKPAIQVGNYWIHGPNTKYGTSASLGKTYNLIYNQYDDIVAVFNLDLVLIATLSRKSDRIS